VQLQVVSVPATINTVDAAVRNQAHSIESPNGEHRTALGGKQPTVYKLPLGEDVFLAVYENRLKPCHKTHVLYTKGGVTKIHGVADIVSLFTINDRLFAHYRFDCLEGCSGVGCGWNGSFVVEIQNDGFTQVFFDDSWST